MLSRIRKAMEEKDEGFTLIELLVVVIIIGILAAIAIPIFLNQRKKANDASVQSDLHSAALAEETYFTDNGLYTSDLTPTGVLQADGLKLSPASNYATGSLTGTPPVPVIAYQAYTSTGAGTSTANAMTGGFCLSATSSSGQAWVYNSLAGGQQPKSVTSCPGSVTIN